MVSNRSLESRRGGRISGRKGWVLEPRSVTQRFGDRKEARHVEGTGHVIDKRTIDTERRFEELDRCRWRVARNREAYGPPLVATSNLEAHRLEQILRLLFVHLHVAVPDHPERPGADDDESGKQLGEVGRNDVLEEDEVCTPSGRVRDRHDAR